MMRCINGPSDNTYDDASVFAALALPEPAPCFGSTARSGKPVRCILGAHPPTRGHLGSDREGNLLRWGAACEVTA